MIGYDKLMFCNMFESTFGFKISQKSQFKEYNYCKTAVFFISIFLTLKKSAPLYSSPDLLQISEVVGYGRFYSI